MTHARAVSMVAGLVLLLMLSACGAGSTKDGDKGPTNTGVCDITQLLVTTSDKSKAGLGSFDLTTGEVKVAEQPLDDVDTVPDLMGCAPVLLSRTKGLLHIQAQNDPFKTVRTVDLNAGVGLGDYAANPQRVVFVSPEKAYVILAGENDVVIVNPSTGETQGRISLERLVWPEDLDGKVDAVDAVAVGNNEVVLALGHYWVDSAQTMNFAGSELAIVDTTKDALMAATASADSADTGIITLTGQNPWRGMAYDSSTNHLYVADSGATGTAEAPVLDGGIEEIDLASRTSMGFVIDEATLGAEINGFARVGLGRLLVLAGRSVVAVDPTQSPVTATPVIDDVDGMKLVGDDLFVWKAGSGLRRYDANSGTEVTSGPVAIGDLPVYGVAPSP